MGEICGAGGGACLLVCTFLCFDGFEKSGWDEYELTRSGSMAERSDDPGRR